MLITCPECQFARNIDVSSIPPKAQVATCPRCRSKFRFRVVEDEPVPAGVADGTSPAGNVPPASQPPVAEEGGYASESAEPMAEQETVAPADVTGEGDSVGREEPQDAQAHLQAEPSAEDGAASAPLAEGEGEPETIVADSTDGSVAPSTDEFAAPEHMGTDVSAQTVTEGAEHIAAEPFVAEGQLAQGTMPAADAHEDLLQEALQTPYTAQGEYVASPLDEAGGVPHLDDMLSDADTIHATPMAREEAGEPLTMNEVVDTASEDSIWDAIAAMGDEPVGGCSYQACTVADLRIPLEDSGLSFAGRMLRTPFALLVKPFRFWCGICSTRNLFLPYLFALFSCAVACAASYGWSLVFPVQVAALVNMLPASLAVQVNLGTLVPQDTLPMVAGAIAGALLVVPFVLGTLVHTVARLLGGSGAGCITSVRIIFYSLGRLFWLLLPGAGIVLTPIWLILLLTGGVRAGYNLSLSKSVVTLCMVGLVVGAGIYAAMGAISL